MGCGEGSGLEAGGEVWLLGEKGRGPGSLGASSLGDGECWDPTWGWGGRFVFEPLWDEQPPSTPRPTPPSPQAGGFGQHQVGSDLGMGRRGGDDVLADGLLSRTLSVTFRRVASSSPLFSAALLNSGLSTPLLSDV